jgi:phosphoglycolate phosphatase-like HAD superfamily hydrolase
LTATTRMQKPGCRRWKSREAILLGDTPYDIEAAGRAGVSSVALRCGGWGNADLSGALAIYDNPIDLLAKFDQSPFSGAN